MSIESPVFPISMDDMPDFAASSRKADTEPQRCQHDGCVNEVVKPSRGRTPKFCPEHRNVSRETSRTKASWPRADEIEKLLTTYLYAVSGGLSLTKLKADGELLVIHGPAVIHEVVELARTDKRLRHWLETLAAPGRYGPLTLAVMPLVFGILAEHKLLPQFVVNIAAPTETE